MEQLTLRQARRLMIGSQGLAGPLPRRGNRGTLRAAIHRLGAVQIDSISVVERSHHLVLWSRIGNHKPEWLYEMQTNGEIFEYWAHANAYVPTELFPHFRHAMLGYPATNRRRAREWVDENQELLDYVLEHVREHGAVTARSFDPPPGADRAEPWAWYGNKPTNLALDVLWTMGKLMIARRNGFQRVYDLTERVIPNWDDRNLPSRDTSQLCLAERALRALGVCAPRWLPDYFRTNWGDRPIDRRKSRDLLAELVERNVGAWGYIKELDEEVVISTEALERRFRPSRTVLLSPFDSLIWDRERTSTMFDFDLKLEAYTPAPKRQYGYFSMPVLYRDHLVGRIDPKVDRRSGVLWLRNVHLEPGFEPDEQFYEELSDTLVQFREFNRATCIEIEQGSPAGVVDRLDTALRKKTE